MENKEKILHKKNILSLSLLIFLLLASLFNLSFFKFEWTATKITKGFFTDILKISPQRLNGIAPANPPVALNRANLSSNLFQKTFENYFMKKPNLWAYLVKINNQISYSIFNQVTFTYSPATFIGNNGQFLQEMYLNSFNRQKTPNNFLLKKHAYSVSQLNELLAKKGILLLVAVSPNIVTMYPELLPEKYKDPTRETRKNSYEIMKKELENFNVTVVDSYQYLMEKKKDVKFRFFEKTGSHWNDVGSCFGANNILNTINEKTKKDIKNFPCLPQHYQYPPVAKDIDLLEIANLAYPNRVANPAPYAPEPEKLYEKAPLNMLIVGTSFNFAIQDHFTSRNIADSKLYFYYRSIRDKNGVFHELKKGKIDWQNDIFKKDVIILESNYSGLGAVGYAFVNDAINALKKDLFKTKKELLAWEKSHPVIENPNQKKNKNKKRKKNKRTKQENDNDLMDEFNPFEGQK